MFTDAAEPRGWPAVVSTVARLGLAAVWLVAGWIKASDPLQTWAAVHAYQVMPRAAVNAVSLVLPWFELALGLLLLLGVGVRLVAVLSGALLVLFIAGVAQAWARGLSIDCGCFGGGGDVAEGQTSYGTELIRDAGFLVLAVWLMIRPRTLFALGRVLTRGNAPSRGGDLVGGS